MNGIQKTLGIGLLLNVASGCERLPGDYLEGTVIKEAGSAAQLVESRGAFFGNESVKLSNPTYLLQIQTSDGVYTTSVFNTPPLNERYKSLEALALVIEEGTKVRFLYKSRFGEDRIGHIYSDEITVLNK